MKKTTLLVIFGAVLINAVVASARDNNRFKSIDRFFNFSGGEIFGLWSLVDLEADFRNPSFVKLIAVRSDIEEVDSHPLPHINGGVPPDKPFKHAPFSLWTKEGGDEVFDRDNYVNFIGVIKIVGARNSTKAADNKVSGGRISTVFKSTPNSPIHEFGTSLSDCRKAQFNRVYESPIGNAESIVSFLQFTKLQVENTDSQSGADCENYSGTSNRAIYFLFFAFVFVLGIILVGRSTWLFLSFPGHWNYLHSIKIVFMSSFGAICIWGAMIVLIN